MFAFEASLSLNNVKSVKSKSVRTKSVRTKSVRTTVVTLTAGILFLLVVTSCSIISGFNKDDDSSKDGDTASVTDNTVYKNLLVAQQTIESRNYRQAKGALDLLLQNHNNKQKPLNSYELAHLHRLYALFYYRLQNIPQAIESYKTITTLSPSAPVKSQMSAWRALSKLYRVLGQTQESDMALREWLVLAEQHGVSKWGVVNTYLKLGDMFEAERSYDNAVAQLNPLKRQALPKAAYQLLVVMFLKQQRFDKVAQYTQVFYQIYPDINHTLLIEHFSGHQSKESKELLFKLYDEYLPIVKAEPIYPEQASSERVEGYCVIEFAVTRSGNVVEPQVLECMPTGYFEKASIDAVKAFQYQPRWVDGKVVRSEGVQHRFTYELESDE